MRHAAVALLMLSGPASAVAGDVAAPACHLTPAECAVVLREVAVDAELFAQDQEIVGVGLSPQDRARALIQRDEDRMAVRFRQLPAPIAREIARVQACQALADGAVPDPECR